MVQYGVDWPIMLMKCLLCDDGASINVFMHVCVQMATLLSKSVKEQLRRKGENEGFSQAPGDCLAYKYYRDVRNPFLLCLSSTFLLVLFYWVGCLHVWLFCSSRLRIAGEGRVCFNPGTVLPLSCCADGSGHGRCLATVSSSAWALMR